MAVKLPFRELHGLEDAQYNFEYLESHWSSGSGGTGPAGPAGPTGPAGATGPQGPIGNTGPAGATGAQGAQGPQGVAGPTGPAGQSFTYRGTWAAGTTYALDDVVTGSDGTSYISLGGGNVGHDPTTDSTHTYWSIMAIHGATGPQGPQGAQGVQGPAGATGAQGPIGNTGPTGATGSQGPIGNTGPAGPTGATGPQGPQGIPGPTTFGFYTNGATHAAGTTIVIPQTTHGLSAGRGILVQAKDNASGNVEVPDINVAAGGDVTLTFLASVAANSKLITLVG
jgi:hypothetical protein